MAWEISCNSLEVEIDCCTCTNLVESCKELLERRSTSTNLHHVYREQNCTADALASLGHEQAFGCKYFNPRSILSWVVSCFAFRPPS